MTKEEKLKEIEEEIKKCSLCKQNKEGKAVPGEGNPNADVVFIGEAPGREEAKTGRPFVGRSGQYLRRLIRELGLKEEEVYITSPVKYLPKIGTPSEKDVAHGGTHLKDQLLIIKPKTVVLLGSVATLGVLGKRIPINKEHGRVIEKDGRRYFVTFHPSAALRFPPLRKLIQEDFEKLKGIFPILQ